MKQTLEAKAQCETCSFSCKLKNIKGTCKVWKKKGGNNNDKG